MTEAPIPNGGTVVIDTSVVISLGEPDNEKYRAFEQFVTSNDVTVRLPEYVAAELGETPDAYQYEQDRLQTARDGGWLESVSVDFTDPDVSRVVDRVRERLASISGDDVTEDEIEKTDTVLAGVAYQLAQERDGVCVLASDTAAERAIADVLSSHGCEDVPVVEGRAFVRSLVDERL